MTKKPPNLLQKLVRGVIRDLINQANSQKADTKPKTKKPVTRSESKPKHDLSKRSHHISTLYQFYIETVTNAFSVVAVRSQVEL